MPDIKNSAIIDIKVMLAELKTDMKYVKKNQDEHNSNLKKNTKELTIIKNGFGNHLQEHERLRAEMFTKLGLFVSAIAIVSAYILKILIP